MFMAECLEETNFFFDGFRVFLQSVTDVSWQYLVGSLYKQTLSTSPKVPETGNLGVNTF